MRNKFTELVNQGVAKFEYQPIAPTTPSTCPMCRLYNGIWGILTDTHMACVETPEGCKTYITGTFVSNKDKWAALNFSSYWGGATFQSTGYMSLSEFFYKHGVTPREVTLNGQPAIELVPIDSEPVDIMAVPGTYATSESAIPQPVRFLLSERDFNECLSCSTIKDVVDALNESKYIPGSHWHVYEHTLVGMVNGKTIIMELNYETGRKIESPALTNALEEEGLKDIFLRQFPKYFMVDSDDVKWRAVLRKSKHNKLPVSSFEELTIEDWVYNIKNIVNSIS